MKEKKKNWDRGYDLKLEDSSQINLSHILFHFSTREYKSKTEFQLKI